MRHYDSDVGSVGQAGGGLPPYLVSYKRNSPTVSTPVDEDESLEVEYPSVRCPRARVFKVICRSHLNERWYLFPCKRRECEVCGPLGRLRHADRIDYGIQVLGECWYFVLTFAGDEAVNSSFKATAVRKVGKFIEWLRRRLGFRFEYSLTWELMKSGRLHCNLIFNYPHRSRLPYAEMREHWGARVTFQHVFDGRGAANYVTKVSSDRPPDDSLGLYVMKKGYQAVPREWGRRVAYSRNWPSIPKPKSNVVLWHGPSKEVSLEFYSLQSTGEIKRVSGSSWCRDKEACECFGHRPGSLVDVVLGVFPGARLIE